jgi:lipopolysaccharide transport protein LptA
MNMVRIYHGCWTAILALTLMIGAPLTAAAGTVEIEAAKMTIYHKQNRVVFHGRVHLTRADFELFCDQLEAFYTDRDLDHANASGHVRLLHGSAVGTANSALLDQAGGTITLRGDAALEQDGNRVEGEQIVHHINRDETIVLPARGGRTHMSIESVDTPAVKAGAGQQQ